MSTRQRRNGLTATAAGFAGMIGALKEPLWGGARGKAARLRSIRVRELAGETFERRDYLNGQLRDFGGAYDPRGGPARLAHRSVFG